MTRPESVAETLAALHAAAFAAPWGAAAMAELLAQPGVFAETADDGFILIRVVADEAEILTLAVAPMVRRNGAGRALVEAAAGLAGARGAASLFLEVAATNTAALALYASTAFDAAGLRRAYYADGADALVMRRTLNS